VAIRFTRLSAGRRNVDPDRNHELWSLDKPESFTSLFRSCRIVNVVGMQQPSESQSDGLFPRFDDLVKPAFLSIAGSIPPFILAAYFSAGNSNVIYGASWFVSLLYGNLGSVLLAYSFVALVARVNRGLWGFFIVLYSILNGILGLFLFGYFYYGASFAGSPYGILTPILALVGPIAGLVGGLLGAVRPISLGGAKVGTTQPTGASLVVSSGILLSSLSLWLVLFAGTTVVITFFAGTALVLLGLTLRGGHIKHPAIGRAVVVIGLVAAVPLLIWATNPTDGSFEIWAALWLTGVALSVFGGFRTIQLSTAGRAIDPSQTPRPMSSGLKLGRAEVFSLAGSLVPGVIIWATLVTPFPGNSVDSLFLYPEFGSPGQVLFAFAIAQFTDTDHRRFWGLTLAIASLLVGIGFFAVYTYPLFFVYSGLASQNGLVFGALQISFFVAPMLCFFGGLLAFLGGHHFQLPTGTIRD
jgi:hypothetical protein